MRALPKRGPARARRADPGLSTLCRTVHTILRASDAVSTTSGRPTKMRTVALLEFKRVRAEIHRRGADATADLRSIFETIGQTRVRKSSTIDGLHEALERGEAHFRQRPGGAEPAAARGCTAKPQDKLRLVGATWVHRQRDVRPDHARTCAAHTKDQGGCLVLGCRSPPSVVAHSRRPFRQKTILRCARKERVQ